MHILVCSISPCSILLTADPNHFFLYSMFSMTVALNTEPDSGSMYSGCFYMWHSMFVFLQLRLLQVIAKSLSSKTMDLARSSDRRDWPLPPLTWDPPRLGWPDSPQKRTPQKRRYSQETPEPALEGRARCARTETSSTNVDCNSEKIEFARRVRALWSPVFAVSDFDDASTGQ